MFIKTAEVKFPNIKFKYSELHKIRGFFGNEYKEFNILHNHIENSDKVIYRYPAVQFKLINENLSIFGYQEEAIELLKNIFLNSDEINVNNTLVKTYEKDFNIREREIGDSKSQIKYKFVTPWIGLNQKNIRDYYKLSSKKEKSDKLNSIIIQNIISFCKFAGYTVKNKLIVESDFHEVKVNLKSKTHLAFKGSFKANFILPDYLGIGKSGSRGYGCLVGNG